MFLDEPNNCNPKPDRDFSELDNFLSSQGMNLVGKNPLLVKEHNNLRVLVCFISNNQWVPVTFCPLADAIILYRKGKETGTEFFVFSVEPSLKSSFP